MEQRTDTEEENEVALPEVMSTIGPFSPLCSKKTPHEETFTAEDV